MRNRLLDYIRGGEPILRLRSNINPYTGRYSQVEKSCRSAVKQNSKEIRRKAMSNACATDYRSMFDNMPAEARRKWIEGDWDGCDLDIAQMEKEDK